MIRGSKTNTLTISVPVDACYQDYAYKCVITDANGNQVTSNVAYLKAQHVYNKYVASKGALIGTIFQSGTGNNIGRYETKGHYTLCVGDGCEAEKLEAEVRRNFDKLMSNQSKIAAQRAGRAVDVSADDFDDAN